MYKLVADGMDPLHRKVHPDPFNSAAMVIITRGQKQRPFQTAADLAIATARQKVRTEVAEQSAEQLIWDLGPKLGIDFHLLYPKKAPGLGDLIVELTEQFEDKMDAYQGNLSGELMKDPILFVKDWCDLSELSGSEISELLHDGRGAPFGERVGAKYIIVTIDNVHRRHEVEIDEDGNLSFVGSPPACIAAKRAEIWGLLKEYIVAGLEIVKTLMKEEKPQEARILIRSMDDYVEFLEEDDDEPGFISFASDDQAADISAVVAKYRAVDEAFFPDESSEDGDDEAEPGDAATLVAEVQADV